jgi:pilus assembly protein CpaC
MKHFITVLLLTILGSTSIILWAATANAAQNYSVEINKGKVIRLGSPAASVAVANPAIADVQVISPHLIYVNGRDIGETSLLAVGDGDGVILQANIAVTHNLSKLQETVNAALQNSNVKIDSTDNAIVLQGDVASPYVAERVQRLAGSFLGENESVINMLSTSQGDQVMLKIKIAEVSRNELKRFGINLQSLLSSGNFIFGLANGRDFVNEAGNLIRGGNDGSLYTSFNSGNTSIDGIIDALQDDGLMTILAEPNLTTKSGVNASFLAGGEFPIPVSGEEDTVTIQYRPFGVSLNFTPVVLDERKISLTVSPEVSSISSTNAVMTNGFQIPSIITRRTSTTVEVGSGESFAIAGLLSRNDRNDISKVPGLGDIPILGTLFRSTEYRQEQSELVIIATPYIVRPASAEHQLATPLDNYVPATDLDRILLGKLYSDEPIGDDQNGVQEDIRQFTNHRPRLNGPAGFILR